jgi:hypothetical protein
MYTLLKGFIKNNEYGVDDYEPQSLRQKLRGEEYENYCFKTPA